MALILAGLGHMQDVVEVEEGDLAGGRVVRLVAGPGKAAAAAAETAHCEVHWPAGRQAPGAGAAAQRGGGAAAAGGARAVAGDGVLSLSQSRVVALLTLWTTYGPSRRHTPGGFSSRFSSTW